MLLPKRGTGSSSENTSDRIVTGFLTGKRTMKGERGWCVLTFHHQYLEMDGLLTKTNTNTNALIQMDVLVVAGKGKT
jgi:hypothetical protein